MPFAAMKLRARRAVHAAFAVPVRFYVKGSRVPLALEKPLTARLHNRIAIAADPVSGGYAQIVEGVTRCIFNREELLAAGLVPKQGDRVSFGAPHDAMVSLDVKDTPNGPIVEKWSVSRK